MKITKLLVGMVLAVGMLGFVGCGEKVQEIPPGTPMEVEGVQVDLPKLIIALESGTPEQQSTARSIQMAFRYRQFEKAVVEADKLANDATLTEEQKQLATEVLAQVKQVYEKAPPQQ